MKTVWIYVTLTPTSKLAPAAGNDMRARSGARARSSAKVRRRRARGCRNRSRAGIRFPGRIKLTRDRAISPRQFVRIWRQVRPNERRCDHDQHTKAGKHATTVLEFRSRERDNPHNDALPDRHAENAARTFCPSLAKLAAKKAQNEEMLISEGTPDNSTRLS
jgi:hypothetical protein